MLLHSTSFPLILRVRGGERDDGDEGSVCWSVQYDQQPIHIQTPHFTYTLTHNTIITQHTNPFFILFRLCGTPTCGSHTSS